MEDWVMNVIDRLLTAMNAHDLEAAVALFDENYRSEQPAHPGRAFVGRAQMHANWKSMFAGIPDFRAEMPRSARRRCTPFPAHAPFSRSCPTY